MISTGRAISGIVCARQPDLSRSKHVQCIENRNAGHHVWDTRSSREAGASCTRIVSGSEAGPSKRRSDCCDEIAPHIAEGLRRKYLIRFSFGSVLKTPNKILERQHVLLHPDFIYGGCPEFGRAGIMPGRRRDEPDQRRARHFSVWLGVQAGRSLEYLVSHVAFDQVVVSPDA